MYNISTVDTNDILLQVVYYQPVKEADPRRYSDEGEGEVEGTYVTGMAQITGECSSTVEAVLFNSLHYNEIGIS